MAKVRLPLASLEARGALAQTVIFNAPPRTGPTAKAFHYPRKPPSGRQLAQRHRYTLAVRSWRALSQEKKQEWNERAAPLGLLGYNLFLRVQLIFTRWKIGEGRIGEVRIS